FETGKLFSMDADTARQKEFTWNKSHGDKVLLHGCSFSPFDLGPNWAKKNVKAFGARVKNNRSQLLQPIDGTNYILVTALVHAMNYGERSLRLSVGCRLLSCQIVCKGRHSQS